MGSRVTTIVWAKNHNLQLLFQKAAFGIFCILLLAVYDRKEIQQAQASSGYNFFE